MKIGHASRCWPLRRPIVNNLSTNKRTDTGRQKWNRPKIGNCRYVQNREKLLGPGWGTRTIGFSTKLLISLAVNVKETWFKPSRPHAEVRLIGIARLIRKKEPEKTTWKRNETIRFPRCSGLENATNGKIARTAPRGTAAKHRPSKSLCSHRATPVRRRFNQTESAGLARSTRTYFPNLTQGSGSAH